MFEPKNRSVPILALVLCISLSSWLILVPLVNAIRIPLGENYTGVISLTSTKNISPYTDYVKYFILLLTPSLIAAIALNTKQQFLHRFLKAILGLITHNRVLTVATTIILLIWLTDRFFYDIGSILFDSFHEGEQLGFLSNFLQLDKPFLKTFLVHGFGLDVLPSLIANQLASSDNKIALTRLFFMLEQSLAAVGCFWVLWEITGAVHLKISRIKIFLITCILFCVLEANFFYISGARDTWYMIQLALTIRFFRIEGVKKVESKLLSVLVGASLPIGFLYVYDRAAYFVMVYLFASTLAVFLEKRIARLWLGGSVLGLAISSLLILGILGSDQVSAIASQVSYWSKYGKYLSFIPLPSFELNFESQYFWLSMLVQSSVLVYLVLEYKKYTKTSLFLQKYHLLILLLFASLVGMRVTLDRSTALNAGSGALVTSLFVAYMMLLAYQSYLENHTIQIQPFSQVLIAIFLIILIVGKPEFNVRLAFIKSATIYNSIPTPDTKILKSDYLQALQVLKPEIDKQSCFFTLTSEGVWYYLFNKTSCSKFSYTFYAKPKTAQDLTVRELEETKPNIVLLTNEMWSNRIDGIANVEAVTTIYQYILDKYKPYRAIESHWFWQRSKKPLKFVKVQSNQGAVDVKLSPTISKGKNVQLTGWAFLPQLGKPADAVYLSYGSQNKLISVARVNLPRPDVAQAVSNQAYTLSGWSLPLPTTVLPTGMNLLRVWSYDAKAEQLVQIGQDISVKVKDS